MGALELTDISAGYEGTTVLRSVQLTVAYGSVTALLGPNGAGKTTLMRVASGLISVESGHIRIAGVEMTGASTSARARGGLCLIPEGRGVFPALTVAENLRIFTPPWSHQKSDERALSAFPILKSLLRRTAGTLSGGQQQMLALSRAFVAEPTVVLLDEVSMGLAPNIVDDIFGALDGLRRTGVALLIVEQYVERALAVADHVVLLDRGTVAYSGRPQAMKAGDLMENYLGIR